MVIGTSVTISNIIIGRFLVVFLSFYSWPVILDICSYLYKRPFIIVIVQLNQVQCCIKDNSQWMKTTTLSNLLLYYYNQNIDQNAQHNIVKLFNPE